MVGGSRLQPTHRFNTEIRLNISPANDGFVWMLLWIFCFNLNARLFFHPLSPQYETICIVHLDYVCIVRTSVASRYVRQIVSNSFG